MTKKQWQQRLASRGYGWYLALKIGKALLAVPYFPAFMTAMAFLAACIACVEGAKGAARLVMEIAGCGVEYWQKKWFSGFSRSYYRSLTMYKRNRPVDAMGSEAGS